MVHLLVSWLLSAITLLLSSRVFDGVKLKGDLGDALWVAALFSVLSFFLHWFFFALLGIATLGLGFVFYFVTRLVAAALVLKVTSALSSRLDISGFAPAIGTALFMALSAEVAERISGVL